MTRISLSLLTLLAACGGDKGDDSSGGDDSDSAVETGHTGDTGGGGDTAQGAMSFELTLEDFDSHDGLPDVTFTTGGGQSYTTDDDGEVTFILPFDAVTVATASVSGYPTLREVFEVDGAFTEFTQRQYLPNAEAFATELDATKGHLIVDVYTITISEGGGADREELPGLSVSLDLESEKTLVTSATTATGITAGTETVGGGNAGTTIYLLNVEPGAGSLSYAAPDGLSCSRGPSVSTAESWTVDIVAATTTRIMLLCR